MAIGGHLITLLALIGAGLGYPTGAPETACIDMTPGHNNVVAMDTISPYMLIVDDLTVESGDTITVAITGRVRFRGFLLQARWASDDLNSATVGMFIPSDRRSKMVACNGQENSALTHTNRRQKQTVQAVWRAPRNAQGPVRFIATVVMSFEEYWTGITSSIVTIEPTRTNVTTGVYQSAVLTTTFSQVPTAAEPTTEGSPTTTGKADQETESAVTEVDGSQTTSLAVTNVTNSSVLNTAPLGEETTLSNAETSTPFERLETTQTRQAQVNQSTTRLSVTLDTMRGTVTPSTDADSKVSSTSTQAVDVTTRELLFNETNFSESTAHNGVAASDETPVLTDFPTTSQSDFHTTKSLMENTTTILDFETSKSTLETSSQYDNTITNTTVLTEKTSLMETPTFEPSTEMKSPVTMFDNSSHVDSTSISVDPPTTLSDATTTQLLPHISTTTFTSTGSSDDSSTTTYSASTSQPNTSTTLSDATATQLLPHTSTTALTSAEPSDDSSTTNYGASASQPNTSTTLSDATATQLLSRTSTTTLTSAEPLDDSSTTTYGASVSQSNTSTLLSDATTERQPNTSTTPFASTESLFDMSTTSTSQPETSTTLSTVVPTPSSNTSSVSTFPSPLITAPVEMFTTLRNVSSTTQADIPISPDDDFVTNATDSAVMTSLSETHFVENSTEQMTTQNTTEMTDTHLFETPTQHSFVPPTTTGSFEGTKSSTDLALISTSVAPSSGSTSVSALVSSGSTSIASKTTSRSTSESMTTTSIPTSESSTMSESTTSGSTTEFTTESISTTQTTNSTEASTTSTMSTNTEQQQPNPEVSTAYVITESANEIRMRVRIENVPFTEDLNDPVSESFGSIARQVEKEVFDLYRRKNVTMVDSVKVLKITQGSIVPEVQILASVDLDDSTKSAWLGVMYNELMESNGRLGNFTVSEMSAVTTDGTFGEVDPCFLLPCPVSMVCYVYQTNCFSNCNLNGYYCLNDGVCQEPTGENQLASCRCDSRHEGDRCEVRKDPVSPPQNGDDKSNLIIAVVWGSIGSACFVLIIILSTWLYKYRRRKQRLRRTAASMENTETGSQNRAQMDSYARRLASIRAGVLIDIGNISMSDSEVESLETGRHLSRTTSLSDAESTNHLPRFIEGGVHIGGLPDILQCASITDYEMDFMNPPLSQKRKSVSFSDVAEMIDFVATENFTLGNPEGSDGNFQVRWDFQIDRSDSRESSS